MDQSLQHSEFAVFTLKLKKNECQLKSVPAIIDYLREKIEHHDTAQFIAIFDHYAHTMNLPEGQISESILAAQCIIFCFGITLPSPDVMAIRPRSIGVTETLDRFVITFVEAPMPVANITMEEWVKSLICEDKAA